jgi:gamma-glutamylcyclotransferase (GGCT)/AIG2-like uncharacterized protein YtfP
MRTVFVYGTLLRGETNHYFLKGSRFLGETSTEPLYDLVDMGGLPVMVSGGSTSVVGELYEVGEETLAALDNLEGHPIWYTRTNVVLADGLTAETYLMDRNQVVDRPLIPSGNWRDRRRAPRKR